MFIITASLLMSCSSTQKAYLNNINTYLDMSADIKLTDAEITAKQVDLIYVKSGERALATMALAFIEAGSYKWVSQDDAVIVTQDGRIKRTAGFDKDLIYVGNLASDPIKLKNNTKDGESWKRVIDAEDSYFGVYVQSHFNVLENTFLTIQNKSFTTVNIVEAIEFNSVTHGSAEWENQFWFDQQSGLLLKSIQKQTPNADIIEISYVSRALRLHNSR